jgi:hypothetical protein
MYSKLFRFATFAAAVLCTVTSCRSARLPWADEKLGQEVNVAFTVENNLLIITSADIDGRPGRFLIGSSQPSSVLDTRFSQAVGSRSHALRLSEKESLPFAGVVADLQGVGDAIIGADVWGSHAVTIDYRAGLVTLQREGIHPELMTVYRYVTQPMITIAVDGRTIPAVVDTTSPDTVVLPGENGRRTARVQVAGTDLGQIDIRSGGVEVARVGNRVLSKFLVSIDYGRRVVGLWRDPRISL